MTFFSSEIEVSGSKCFLRIFDWHGGFDWSCISATRCLFILPESANTWVLRKTKQTRQILALFFTCTIGSAAALTGFCYSEAPENQTCLIIVSWIEGKLWKWQSRIDSLHRQKSIHSAWLWILLKSSVISSSTLMMSDEATRVQINDAASLQVFTHSV